MGNKFPVSSFQFPTKFSNFPGLAKRSGAGKLKIENSSRGFTLIKHSEVSSKGFTLIELLIVIVIVGILSVGTFIAIDPVDRVNFANDAKAQTALGAVARAAESYSTTHGNLYPPSVDVMVSSGQFKSAPQLPERYTLFYKVPSGAPPCTNEGDLGCTKFVVYAQLKSKKYQSAPYQLYTSDNGKTCQVATEPNIETTCP